MFKACQASKKTSSPLYWKSTVKQFIFSQGFFYNCQKETEELKSRLKYINFICVNELISIFKYYVIKLKMRKIFISLCITYVDKYITLASTKTKLAFSSIVL